MPKQGWVIFLCFWATMSYAQNYRCINPDSISYYVNANSYLRGIRIDSVRSINNDTVFYPFRTARGSYSQGGNPTLEAGGSWLGSQIIISNDGAHYFINYNNDTVVIKTQAALNDTWMLYDDTGSTFYMASVTSVDTMTVAGVADSAKTITITAMNSQGVVSTDGLNNQEIVITKNNGFAKEIDLFNFPRQKDNLTGYDVFTDKAGSRDFIKINFVNPDRTSIWDFNAGDEYQFDESASSPYHGKYVLSRVDDVTVGPAQEHIYSLVVVTNRYGYIKTTTEITTSTMQVTPGPLLNLKLLPEEWGMEEHLWYKPGDTVMCAVTASYTSASNFIRYTSDSTAKLNTFEPCGISAKYAVGLGMTDYSVCTDPTSQGNYSRLRYYNKNGKACGIAFYSGIDSKENEENAFHLFPNPASNYINVQYNRNHLCEVQVFDLVGKLMKTEQVEKSPHSLAIDHLSPGVYNLILWQDGMVAGKEIFVKQ